MIYFNQILKKFQSKKFSLIALMLFAVYFVIRMPYFTIDVFNYDEMWHSGYMNSGFLNQTKLYQAFSPLYWIFGHIFLKLFGYADLAFGRIVLRLFISSLYLVSIIIFYKTAQARNNPSPASVLLITLLILSSPVSFFGGKAITPEYIQLCLFSSCLYFLSDSEDKEKN